MNKKLADSRFSLSARFTMLAVFLIASMILSVRFGSTNVPLSDILSEVSAFISTGRPAETASSMILWQIRIPRTIFAAFCGMGLSLCGLVLQTMTRNDLADPYVLGVSSGASTVQLSLLFGDGFPFSEIIMFPQAHSSVQRYLRLSSLCVREKAPVPFVLYW